MQPPPAGTTGLTYADLARFPEGDRNRYELIDGELFVTPSPVTRHQRAVVRIASAFLDHVDEHGGDVFPAPIDVFFADDTVLEPDVVVVAVADLRVVEEKLLRGAPSLVVEVSSPSTRRTDQVRKRRVYEREGVPEYWFVDIDAEQVHLYRLGADRAYGPPEVREPPMHLDAVRFPGFTMPVASALGHRPVPGSPYGTPPG